MKKKNKQTIARPPIVVVMGHIDHGKSRLLDHIRKTNVVGNEAGKITQHVGAYEVEASGKKITFLDTPGHAAFTAIRSRGAKVADIAILVVAADDGPKPQTLEAWKTIKDAGLPAVVAISKIDLPNTNPEQVKARLAEHEILVESYGGNVPSVNISSETGEGVDDLLETILLVAELEEFTTDPNAPVSGTVIESHLDPRRGIAATLVVQNGTLESGTCVVANTAIAPVRIFEDQNGTAIKTAVASTPVRIIGWNKVPPVGAIFESVKNKKEAESVVERNVEKDTYISHSNREKTTNDEKSVVLPLIIKADTVGSLEAFEHEIDRLRTNGAIIQILHTGIGALNDSDIQIARDTEGAIAIGFNVPVDASAKDLAERTGTNINTHDVIYEITKFLEKEIGARRDALETERITGTAEILKVFSRTNKKQVVGGKVTSGQLLSNREISIKRRDNEIARGRILNLQSKKEVVQSVAEGSQFGAMIECKIEILEGDTIEIVEKKAT